MFPSNVPTKALVVSIPIGVHSLPTTFSPFSFALAPKSKSASKYTIVSSVMLRFPFSSSVNSPLTKSAKYLSCSLVYICQLFSSVISGVSVVFPSHLFGIPSSILPSLFNVYWLLVFSNVIDHPNISSPSAVAPAFCASSASCIV